MMERPRSRISGFVSDVVTVPTYPLAAGRSTGIQSWQHKIMWITLRTDR